MTDKLNAIVPKIVPLIRLLSSPTEQEAVAALRMLLRLLSKNGLDIHALAERVERGGGEPLSAGEMQKIYDAAYQKGHADGADQGRRSAILAAQPIGTFAASVDDGVNGYAWQDIAQYCARNPHCLNSWKRQFVDSVAAALPLYNNVPTAKQAVKLRQLFLNRFAGRIE